MRRADHGLTLLELLVAMVIFSAVAAALAQTLIAAQHARRTSANWMRATQLAAERMERVRAGDREPDSGPLGIFTRSWSAHPVPGYALLRRVEVTVSWSDRGPQRFTLCALMREAG